MLVFGVLASCSDGFGVKTRNRGQLLLSTHDGGGMVDKWWWWHLLLWTGSGAGKENQPPTKTSVIPRFRM